MNLNRIRHLNSAESRNGAVCYLMSREQRVEDNWALIYAYDQALRANTQLIVIFVLANDYPHKNLRNISFMLDGLRQVEAKLKSLNIPLIVLFGNPIDETARFANSNKIGMLIIDFDPLKFKVNWRNKIAQVLDIPVIEVDSHNIVPAFYVSDKQEYGAYTIRNKIKKLLPEFLDSLPKLEYFRNNIDFEYNSNILSIDNINDLPSQPTAVSIPSGSDRAINTLKIFIETKLSGYSVNRNNPANDATSNLSPYLHFGQVSAQRIALEVMASEFPDAAKEEFLEELIIRKELSDNYCLFNPNYDNFEGFPSWAKDTLNAHRNDKREYIYTLEEFEQCTTKDLYWNAAQKEMMQTGKMHGYMRMYWCKKILEWSRSPEEAIESAIHLNDKYSIDGRDPNGYTGIAWSIGGVHDRPWKERSIFGKIRYMNAAGLERKFNMKEYTRKVENNF